MKDLGEIKICLGLQIEHLSDGISMHQSSYTVKILNCFYIDKLHSVSSFMVV